MTELPVLGDHLAIAADAAAGVGAKAVTAAAFSFTRVFLTFIYINAVGLQCAELKPWVAVTRVASLHRDTFPRTTYVRGSGTLVNIWIF